MIKIFALAGAAEIEICSDIEPGDGAKVRAALAAANGSPVRVRINSAGGDLAEGQDMYAAIREYAGPTEAFVTGLAASAATLPMCACDTITMAEGAQIMIHSPHAGARGRAPEFRSVADSLEKAELALARVYTARTGASEDEILALMRAETYLDSAEALTRRFCDKVMPNKVKALAAVPLEKISNAPEKFARLVARARAQVTPDEVLKALGLEGEVTLEDVLKAIAALKKAAEGEPAPSDPAPAPESEPSPEEAPAAESEEDDEMMAAIAGLPPAAQAKVLAVHAKNLAALEAGEKGERESLMARVPTRFKGWAAKAPVSALRDFCKDLPAGAPAREPAVKPAAKVNRETPTDADRACAKALGGPFAETLRRVVKARIEDEDRRALEGDK